MILRTLILCFTLLSTTVHAEFEFVTTNEDLDEIYFIDLSTLDILKNDHKTVQVLINYQNGFITNNSSVAFSALEENIYDCTKDTIENNFIEYYSETNARGDMVYKKDELSEFIVDFDSPEYRIKEKICN